MSVSQILFEIRGRIHEQVVRDAFRLAGNKLPGIFISTPPLQATFASNVSVYQGQWEFVKKGEPPVVGITKLDGVTLEELKRPRRQIAPPELLAASSPTSVTEPGSKADASRP